MGKKSAILLMLDSGKNRRRLMAWLGQDFEIATAETVGFESPGFDLAILDHAALERFSDQLKARKASEAPVLLPLLLLASSREVSFLADHLPRMVDEVILSPLKKPELLARVANLLKLRHLSAELQSSRGSQRIQAASRKIPKLQVAREASVRVEAAHLRQVQKMEALSAFAGGIAHEFNNVLGAIKGFIELAMMTLEAGLEAEKVRSKLEAAMRAGDRALALVKQILAFSRHTEREAQPVEILPIIKEALKLLQASIPCTIEIRQRLEAQCGLVLADPVQLSQIFMNLTSNASQAMGARGGVLEVGLEPIRLESGYADTNLNLPAGDYVRLTVSDTGPGIDPKVMGHIFDPFFTTRTGGEGTGLGLSTIHGIVKNLAGGVKVISTLGQGSTFQIYLPQYKSAPWEEPALGPVPRGTEHLLLVDDEPAMVQISCEYLESLGYRITARGSGIEAWEEFRRQPESFDLVITDLTMPSMTGLDLAAAMLRLRPDLPIILTTGYDGVKIAEQAKELGLRNCLMKPLVLRQLGRVVRRVLDKKSAPSQGRRPSGTSGWTTPPLC